MPSLYTYRSTNPRTVLNPILSMPLIRPACRIMGWTDAQKAEWTLTAARNNLAALDGIVPAACAALGRANRMKGPMRRYWQAQAFRSINTARARLRAAHKALRHAETAMLALPAREA